MAARIVIVGSFNAGLTFKSRRLPAEGESILGDYSVSEGGKGSNQAVQVARLGNRSYMVGCVGKDSYGEMAVNLWRREGVDYSHVRVSDEDHTGVAVILVDERGVNMIVIDPGANYLLSKRDVDEAKDIILSANVLLTVLEIPVETAVYSCKVAKEGGVTTVFNPAPAQPIPPDAFKYIDIMTPNETELKTLLGLPPDKPARIGDLASKLVQKGVGKVVVTLGEKGGYVHDGRRGYAFPAFKVNTIDPTGAGDAFNGALAVALAEGKDLEESVKFAAAAGALTVTKLEVIPALPYRKEVEKFLEERSREWKIIGGG